MSLKVKDLTLDIGLIDLDSHLHDSRHILLHLIGYLLTDLRHKLKRPFLCLSHHDLIIPMTHPPNQLSGILLGDVSGCVNTDDILGGQDELLEVELDGDEVDALSTELLGTYTAQLQGVGEESVHGVDLGEGTADIRFVYVFEGETVQFLRVDGAVEGEVEGGRQVDLLVAR